MVDPLVKPQTWTNTLASTCFQVWLCRSTDAPSQTVVQWVCTRIYRNVSSARKNDPSGTTLNQFDYGPSFVPNPHESDAIRDAICGRVFVE
jgi:hypothetical protein